MSNGVPCEHLYWVSLKQLKNVKISFWWLKFGGHGAKTSATLGCEAAGPIPALLVDLAPFRVCKQPIKQRAEQRLFAIIKARHNLGVPVGNHTF